MAGSGTQADPYTGTITDIRSIFKGGTIYIVQGTTVNAPPIYDYSGEGYFLYATSVSGLGGGVSVTSDGGVVGTFSSLDGYIIFGKEEKPYGSYSANVTCIASIVLEYVHNLSIYQSIYSSNNLEHVYVNTDSQTRHSVLSVSGSVPGMSISNPASTNDGYYILTGTPTTPGTYTITFTGNENLDTYHTRNFQSTWYITVIRTYSHTINYTASGSSGTGSGSMSPTVVYDTNTGNTNLIFASNGFTAPTGHHFAGWRINDTGTVYQQGNTYSVGANGSVTAYAYWVINTYTVSLTPSPSDKGSVTGAGSYTHGSSVTITAAPASHYHFVNWSDGNTSASRTFTVTSNVALTAYFAIDAFPIIWKNWDGSTLETDANAPYGSTPSYDGSTPTKAATAQYSYTFTGWSPTPVTVTQGAEYTAQFSSAIRSYPVTLQVTGDGSVTGAGTYAYGTSVTIAAIAAEHSHFVRWSDNDTNSSRTFTITGPISLTAVFALDTCIISAVTDGDGTVSGAGTYEYGDEVRLVASPGKSAKFAGWSDGYPLRVRTFTAVEDVELTAYFRDIHGELILSYNNGGKEYTLECTTITSVSDNIKASVLQTPIPTYSADNAFAFDSGASENIQFTIVRKNPENPIDPPDFPDNIPDMYELDWGLYDTTRWGNRIWKLALISMVDRWQMKTDGISVLYLPYVLSENEEGTVQGVYHAPIDENGYIKTLSITYDISSFEVLKVTLNIAIGSMNKGAVK